MEKETKMVLGDAVDYRKYSMKFMEKLACFLAGGLVSALVMYIFYERWYLSLVLGIGGGIAFVPMRRKQLLEKRRKQLTLQFKEMLESVKSSLGSETVHNAFMKAKKDLEIQFPEDAYIMRELTLMMQGTLLKQRLEDMVNDFAERSGIEDIQNFAVMFGNCYHGGGNMQEIVGKCITIINEKIEVNMDIETMIAGQKSEQNILLVLPVVFVVMLKSMGGMVDMESAMGMISMTIAIIIFLGAYLLSRKIIKIDV